MSTVNGYTEKYGLIAFFDVIGVKKMDARGFISFFNEWQSSFSGYIERRVAKSQSSKGIRVAPDKEDVRVLGDTVIMPRAIEKQYARYNINHYALTLHPIVRSGLMKGLLFRGAIAEGEYLVSQTAILGEAVNEAAEAHDMGQWGGIVLALNTGIAYSNDFIGKEITDCEKNVIIEYDVPSKCSGKERMWTIAWPLAYEMANRLSPDRTVKARNEFLEHIEKARALSKPDERAQSIFDNTIKYYDDYCRNNADFIENATKKMN